MVLDTSALIAIMFREPEAERLKIAVADAAARLIGTPTMVEAAIVLRRLLPDDGQDALDAFFTGYNVTLVPFAARHISAARTAIDRFGKGRHPAALNFGDCMSYAVALIENEPLLFKGNDFAHTDILAAAY
ncbi:MAG: type II toxin-antitoxin system VapC family toxin [Proteobacteria bacterium]|nr:type II toxin-antitoxin system VapC family toxin [Pseudomonadota bacterium]MDA1057850.1 type II toxin-antitoxin system VapC family toxin [Pseudomonadota bacterium]